MSEQSFGSMLRDARRKTGKTSRDVCLLAGLEWPWYTKVENGRVPPPDQGVRGMIYEALDLTAEDASAIERTVSSSFVPHRSPGGQFYFLDVTPLDPAEERIKR